VAIKAQLLNLMQKHGKTLPVPRNRPTQCCNAEDLVPNGTRQLHVHSQHGALATKIYG